MTKQTPRNTNSAKQRGDRLPAWYRAEFNAERKRRHAQFFAVDQDDPDWWLQIPEFGVTPASVAFEGFAFPIIYRDYPGAAEPVHKMVALARQLLRKSGVQSMAQYHSLSYEFHHQTDIDANDQLIITGTLTPQHWAAFNYEAVMDGLQGFERRQFLPDRIVSLATAGEWLATWAAEGAEESVKKMYRDRARAAGLASAQTRADKERDARIVAAAERLGWPAEVRHVAKTVAQSFSDIGAARISQILRVEKNRRSQPS